MKYRRKSNIIEAFKWTGGPDQTEDPIWIIQAIKNGDVYFENSGTSNVVMKIKTLEGTMTAVPGTYIVKGVANELFPVREDIFHKNYEKVEE